MQQNLNDEVANIIARIKLTTKLSTDDSVAIFTACLDKMDGLYPNDKVQSIILESVEYENGEVTVVMKFITLDTERLINFSANRRC